MKHQGRERLREGFTCDHCHGWVSTAENIGTQHRNHCPTCLWSKHVDSDRAGDRKSDCQSGMEPIGFTFKQKGTDKYGKPRQGELMIIHRCSNEDCGKISINRIAADDNSQMILEILQRSQEMSQEIKSMLEFREIRLLTESDKVQVETQLFGKRS